MMRKNKKRWLPVFLLTAGVALLALGIVRGEERVVLQKAIRICLECIGIG